VQSPLPVRHWLSCGHRSGRVNGSNRTCCSSLLWSPSISVQQFVFDCSCNASLLQQPGIGWSSRTASPVCARNLCRTSDRLPILLMYRSSISPTHTSSHNVGAIEPRNKFLCDIRHQTTNRALLNPSVSASETAKATVLHAPLMVVLHAAVPSPSSAAVSTRRGLD